MVAMYIQNLYIYIRVGSKYILVEEHPNS